jgi:hypothetical protein
VATGKDLRRLALARDGTAEAPHFDRAAFCPQAFGTEAKARKD